MDPTYTGLNRLSLDPLPSSASQTISVEGLRLGGRAPKFTSQARFRDLHGIGSSIFDDKGSVLMANLDAVLNLTGHIGGYIANGTRDNNTSFYSLLLEDHNLEMHSYVQWRRPLSVSRVIMARVLGKPQLKTAQLDTILKTDVHALVALKPCDGYRIIALITHGGGDSLTGSQSVTLKDLITVALFSLPVIHKTQGKGLVVFPFSPSHRISGTMTSESILDFALLCTMLYERTWCFRPYMCHDLVCIAFAVPRADPDKGSVNEQRLLALWDAMRLLPPPMTKHTSPSTVHPEIAKVAELDLSEAPQAEPTSSIHLDASKNFSRLFDGIDVGTKYPELTRRIDAVLAEQETPNMARDRVEVLSRWQLPDSPDLVQYPF